MEQSINSRSMVLLPPIDYTSLFAQNNQSFLKQVFDTTNFVNIRVKYQKVVCGISHQEIPNCGLVFLMFDHSASAFVVT